MFVKKLFFPGEFDEAYIYNQNLMLINADGALFYVDLGRLVSDMEEKSEAEHKFIPTLLFANKKKLRDQLSSLPMMANNHVKKGLIKAVDDFPDLQEMDGSLLKHIGETDVTDPLDIKIYYHRLYMGTDSGMYHIDLDIRAKEGDVEIVDVQKRHDALTSNLSAHYGVINLSCGNEGLFTVFGEFGREIRNQFATTQLQKSASRSLRTDWLRRNLLNYQAPTELEYRIVSIQQDKKADQITKSKKEPTALSYGEAQSISGEMPNADDTAILSIFNSRDGLIIQLETMDLLHLSLQKDKEQHFQAKKPKRLSVSQLSRILGVYPIDTYSVLEMYDRVLLLVDQELVTLVEGEAIAVKTYPDSKSHQNLATVIVEEGVYLIAVFNETVLA